MRQYFCHSISFFLIYDQLTSNGFRMGVALRYEGEGTCEHVALHRCLAAAGFDAAAIYPPMALRMHQVCVPRCPDQTVGLSLQLRESTRDMNGSRERAPLVDYWNFLR